MSTGKAIKDPEMDKAQASYALEEIKRYAREHCINPAFAHQVSDADLIASGLAVLINHDPDQSFEIAASLVEDVNDHDAAAYLRNR